MTGTEVHPLNLKWGKNVRGGDIHIEWHAPCGCAFHPEPSPHVHPCPMHMTLKDWSGAS